MSGTKSEEYWKSHIANAQASKSKTKYCQEHKISEKQFYYWQRKLKEVKGENKKQRIKTTSFVPVQVSGMKKQCSINVSLPGGVKIESMGYPDISWLTRLVYSLSRKVA